MNVKSLLVAGGGTAGLIAAIILKKNLNIQIDVVHSSNIGIVGVGEGSTEHFKDFMDFVGIDQYELIKSCDATYKSGIMFENWTEKPYLHSVGSQWNVKNAQYSFVYANQISKQDDRITDDLQWQNKINKWFLNQRDQFPYNQFHFNTHKLNEFLINVAKSLGINFYDDEITAVNVNEQGNIQSIIGNLNEYRYDFYIDSTGFKRILIDKLGAKWQSYGKYLKMKSAITFQTPDEENYNLWTVARAMDAGWMFRIPVWGRYGNGYIFDSNYYLI
jgi:flavin-dependent dehydrogenase